MRKILLTLSLLLFFYNNAYGLITVDITRGNLDPLPIAVSLFMSIQNQKKYHNLKLKN